MEPAPELFALSPAAPAALAAPGPSLPPQAPPASSIPEIPAQRPSDIQRISATYRGLPVLPIPLCAMPRLRAANHARNSRVMGSCKEDCESLMSAVLPVAERILGERHSLRPFGSTLSVDDRMAEVGASASEASFDTAALVAEFQASFRDGAVRGELKASALVYLSEAPEGPGTVVCVELDHRELYSLVVSFPYRFTDAGELVIDEPFAVEGKHQIFA
jgi:hypothetical protein